MSNNLAIEGGEPVTDDPVPYHRPAVGEDEIEEVAESIRSKWIVGPGPYCEKVENELESRWDVPGVLTTTSCTHALELAMLAIDLSSNDEVIVPSFTYVSSALSVLRAGGTPRFADIDPGTLTLTPETIGPALTENTRAVMMVHYGGYPGPTKDVKKYCDDEDLILIEDAAQAFDTHRDGQPAGTFGRFGAFSFHATKSMTCGEGGALFVNQESDVKDCEMIRDKGTDRSVSLKGDVDRYTWRSRGSSYVLSDILGAVLWKQLERWPDIKQRRLDVQSTVRDFISEIDTENVLRAIESNEEVKENGHLTGFIVPEGTDRDWLLEAFQAEGVNAREHYHPLHRSPYAQDHLNVEGDFSHSEKISRNLIRLPAYPDLNDRQLSAIREALEKIYPYIVK